MTPFSNELIRKYCIIFGTLFNDVIIQRDDANNPSSTPTQRFKVPIEFGPREKFLAMTNAKPDEKKRAIQLPRMSFEMTGMTFDASRKLERTKEINVGPTKTLRGAPWNFNFRLSIMTKNMLDATKIVEQVLFMFQPDFTVDVKLLEGFDHIDRISTVYNSIGHEDVYEGNFEQRHLIVWTIDFTMKAWLYGLITTGKQIKFIDIRQHASLNEDSAFERLTIQPGMDANGNPTTDINNTVPYQQIEQDDDWDFITLRYGFQFEDN